MKGHRFSTESIADYFLAAKEHYLIVTNPVGKLSRVFLIELVFFSSSVGGLARCTHKACAQSSVDRDERALYSGWLLQCVALAKIAIKSRTKNWYKIKWVASFEIENLKLD